MTTVRRIIQKQTKLVEAEDEVDKLIDWVPIFDSESGIESSMTIWPADASLKKQVNLPLSLAFCPFAQLEPKRASFDSQKLPKYRCFSCKAFINKLCPVTTPRMYDCSICGSSNAIDEDIDTESPELTNMVYEVQASRQHVEFANTPPTIVFVIDISRNNRDNIYNFSFAVKQFIRSLPNKDFFQVMIVSYDKYVHYYDLSGEEMQKVVMTDEFYHKRDLEILNRVEDKLQLILEEIEVQAQNSPFAEGTAMIEALEFALIAARPYAGRILVVGKLQSKLPMMRGLAIPPGVRSDSLDNHRFLERRLSRYLAETRLSISFFIFAKQYIDLLSFYPLTRSSNGSLHLYNPGQQLRFYYDISSILLSQDNYDTQLKIRYSPGIKLAACFGNYLPMRGSNDYIRMVSCNSNANYLFEFNVEAKISRKCSTIQFSILYTTKEGKRMFRVMNYVVEMSNNIEKILKSVDYGQVSYFYLKASAQTMDTVLDQKAIRTIVQDRFSKFATNNRQYVNDGMAEYSRMTYCILRSKHLNTPYAQTPEQDKLSQLRSRFLRINFYEMALAVFPLLYAVDKQIAVQHHEASDSLETYPILELTPQAVNPHSVLMVDRGIQLLLFINIRNTTNPPIPQKVLTLIGKGQLNQQTLSELAAQLHWAQRAHQLKQKLRAQKQTGYEPLRVVTDISPLLIFGESGNLSYENFVNFMVK